MSERTTKTEVLDAIISEEAPVLSVLAEALKSDSMHERLFALTASLAHDGDGVEKLMNALVEVDRRLWVAGAVQGPHALGYVALAAHLLAHQRETNALELAERRRADNVPIVEVSKRTFLVVFVGINTEESLQVLVDRLVGLLEQGRVRKLILVVENVLRLDEPILGMLKEETIAHDATLEVKHPLSL